MKINEKIIKLRKERGLSQEEFGNEINVSRQAVSKWETGESIPDTNKIQDIVKKFNLNYEYLLNDEIENIKDIPKEQDKNVNSKKFKKITLKIIIVCFIVYLLICIYKFIILYRNYKIADSFSEENFWVSEEITYSSIYKNGENFNTDTTKFGNTIIEETYKTYDEQESFDYPDSITYSNFDKKVFYTLSYNKESDTYTYHKDNVENIENIKKRYSNYIKLTTFKYIPSNFVQIFIAAINPKTKVSIINNEYTFIVNKNKVHISLNNDFLISFVEIEEENKEFIEIIYSYDYVQDHFKDINDPLEEYEDMIIIDKE